MIANVMAQYQVSSSFIHLKTTQKSNSFYSSDTGLDLNTSARSHGSRSLAEVHTFLQNFVDQSPPPENDGYRWMAQTPTLVERMLGVPLPVLGQTESKCVFVPDVSTWIRDYSFLSATFLGIELDLLLHDILTWNLIDMLFENPAVAVLCTYLMHLLRVFVRARLGRANIAKKTQVDDRFLL